jgi:fatty acid-binding protein DegV
LAVADGACGDMAAVAARLERIPTQHPLVSVPLGPVVGAHTGPQTVGVCYLIPAVPGATGE